MRNITTFIAAVACLSVAGLATMQAQEKAAPPGVTSLIEKLGSPKFIEREQAMKELEALGSTSLPVLRPALESKDAEIRRRAEILVRKFEDQELTTKLLAGKKVRLNVKDATIAEAAAALTNQSYSVKVPPEFEKRSDIKITLDTGDTTFWEALHALGLEVTAAAPGVEQQPPKQTAQGIPVQIGGLPYPASTTIPFGKSVKQPVCFSGSVRILLIKSALLTSDEFELTLEVTNELDLLDFASAGNPRIDKALGDEGRTLSGQVANAAGEAGAFGIPRGVAMPANVVVARNLGNSSSMFPTPAAKFQPFQFVMRLTGGNKSAKAITEVCGKIPVKSTIETEPIIAMENVLNAAGKSAKTRDGKTVRLLEVNKTKTGEVTLKVVMEGPGQNAGVVGGVVQFQGALPPIPRNAKIGDNGPIFTGALSPLRLLDAAGKEFTQVGVTSASGTFSAAGMTLMETVVFTPKSGMGEASRLALPSYRSITFDVPFSFKNIPLQ